MHAARSWKDDECVLGFCHDLGEQMPGQWWLELHSEWAQQRPGRGLTGIWREKGLGNFRTLPSPLVQ